MEQIPTKRQFEYLQAIKKLLEKGYSPTYQDIMEEMKMENRPVVHDMVKKLEQRGFLKKDKRNRRIIKVIL